MYYYLVTIQKLKDGTNPIAIYSYASRESVFSAYHSTLASNYASSTLEFFCVEVLDGNGDIVEKEHYYFPVEPEPEPNEE